MVESRPQHNSRSIPITITLYHSHCNRTRSTSRRRLISCVYISTGSLQLSVCLFVCIFYTCLHLFIGVFGVFKLSRPRLSAAMASEATASEVAASGIEGGAISDLMIEKALEEIYEDNINNNPTFQDLLPL